MNAETIAAPVRRAGQVLAELQGAEQDADVDDALAPAVEDRVHERAELADLVGRPCQRAVEQVEDAAEHDQEAGEDPRLDARRDAATQAMRKPMTVSALGDRPSRPRPTAIGVMRPRTRARVSGETSEPLTRRPGRPRAGGVVEAERPRLAARERLERLGDDGVDGLAALPARRHEPDLPQLAEVPRHERLRQPDVLDELAARSPGPPPGGGRSAGGWRPRGPCGPAHLAQVVGDVDDGRDRAADSGARWGTRVTGDLQASGWATPSDQRRVHINGD